MLRGTRRPRPPAAHDLARLGGVIQDIPRRSLAASLRNARLLATAAAAVTLVALGGGGVWAWRGRYSAQQPVDAPRGTNPIASARPVAAAATADAPTLAPATVALPPLSPPPRARHATPRSVRRAPVAAPEVDTLTREIALIDAARRDVATMPARSLAAADAHRRAFPDGQLGAEREFLAVEALRRLGRSDEARARASALSSRYPASSYATRAVRLLQSAP
jgi:hypothetical protein